MIRRWKTFPKTEDLPYKLALWTGSANFGFCFNGSGWGQHFGFQNEVFAGIGVHKKFEGSLNEAAAFVSDESDFIVCHLSYDVKNELEALNSANLDHVQFPDYGFVVPEVIVLVHSTSVKIGWDANQSDQIGDEVMQAIENCRPDCAAIKGSAPAHRRLSKLAYLEQIKAIQTHIQAGDIYQANFCQEIYWENLALNPAQVYYEGFVQNPNPFSVFYKMEECICMSWSPERYVSFHDRNVLSQPMKGTAKRGENAQEDQRQLAQLKASEKDRRENVMIVDMVRNDLSRTAEQDSVKVPELYVIETYPKVHQMYSTVTSRLKSNTTLVDTVLTSFPMGSMTGAPKIRAMQIIESYEKSKRGLFSGTIGFITPDKNADFNVVIRSLLYNEKTGYLSAHVGGGITALSDPMQELEECDTKLQPMVELIDRLMRP